MFALLLSLSLAASSAWAGAPSDCAAPATVADVEASTLQTTLSFATIDIEGFEASYRDTHAKLNCVTERLSATTVVSLHRTEALGAFFQKDPERTRNAFQALVAVNPDWSLPQTLAPAGGEVEQLFHAARQRPPSLMVPVDVPASLTLLIDAQPATQRPANTPAVMQVLDSKGVVRWNAYLQAGEPMPDLQAIAATAPAGSQVEPDAELSFDTPERAHEPVESVTRFGVELGLVTGVRVERQRSSGTISGFGLRAGFAVGAGANAVASAPVLLPTLDLRLGGHVDLETTIGLAAVEFPVVVGLAIQPHGEHFFGQLGILGGAGVATVDLGVGWMF